MEREWVVTADALREWLEDGVVGSLLRRWRLVTEVGLRSSAPRDAPYVVVRKLGREGQFVDVEG